MKLSKNTLVLLAWEGDTIAQLAVRLISRSEELGRAPIRPRAYRGKVWLS